MPVPRVPRALAKTPGFVVGRGGHVGRRESAPPAAIVNVALQVLDPSLPFADPRTLLVVQEHNTAKPMNGADDRRTVRQFPGAHERHLTGLAVSQHAEQSQTW